MKKLVIPIMILLALALAACGQSAEKLNNTGNEAFENQEYEAALTAYHRAVEDSPEMAEPHYNAANSHYRLEDYGQAQQEIEQALVNGENLNGLDQNSFYNLGNTFFQTEEYETAIEAYKEALRLNPDDLEAKQNLELTLRQLQQQQQDQEEQDQQDQQQQDQDQQDQQQNDQQDQQQDDEQQDGQQDQQQDDQQQDAQQDQQQDDQQQDGQQDQQQDDQEQNGEESGQPQQIAGLTKEQARQLFAAAAQGTESLEEYLQQILVFPGAPPMQDW